MLEENEGILDNKVEILHTQPEPWQGDGRGWPPLYVSRTFEFHPEDRRNNGEITITFEVRKTDKLGTWEMEGPGVENRNLGPGVFTLRFKRNSPQQLVSLKINPDPGGGRVP